jgi:hypothetical protein
MGHYQSDVVPLTRHPMDGPSYPSQLKQRMSIPAEKSPEFRLKIPHPIFMLSALQ